jgi:hypothetical protein
MPDRFAPRGDTGLRISNNEVTGRRIKERLNRGTFLQPKPALARTHDFIDLILIFL